MDCISMNVSNILSRLKKNHLEMMYTSEQCYVFHVCFELCSRRRLQSIASLPVCHQEIAHNCKVLPFKSKQLCGRALDSLSRPPPLAGLPWKIPFPSSKRSFLIASPICLGLHSSQARLNTQLLFMPTSHTHSRSCSDPQPWPPLCHTCSEPLNVPLFLFGPDLRHESVGRRAAVPML